MSVFKIVADPMSFVVPTLEITDEDYEDFMYLFLDGIADLWMKLI